MRLPWGRYQLVTSIKNELSPYLNKLMELNSKDSWVFVDSFGGYTREAKEFYPFYGISALNKKNDYEVCYVLNKDNAGLLDLQKCIKICSLPIWFFLGILTTTSFSDIVDHQMTDKKMREMVRGARMLVLNAYDREGYVFWEKNE